jgi:hypothetical protein
MKAVENFNRSPRKVSIPPHITVGNGFSDSGNSLRKRVCGVSA